MRNYLGLAAAAGVLSWVAAAGAQAPAGAAFDGIYRLVSATNVNATYTDKTGRMAPCPSRKPGPLHIANGRVRYTNATGYKLKGTVGPQGELTLDMAAPSNAGNAGARPLEMNVSGTIDGSGAARVRQTGNSCSYDFVWQRQSR
jgi:hypothetical protein